MKSYEISNETMAIVPVDKNSSKVIEEQAEYLVSKTPFEIVDESCKYFGSSYAGRHIGTKSLTGISYKSPIIVEETRNLIFFPTTSPKEDDCCWFNLSAIDFVKRSEDRTHIQVVLKQGNEVSVSMSYPSFDNQVLRATRLESVLRRRKSEI